jgi:hypothetical protein
MKPLLERVEAEIVAGRRWRAKEIIRGNLALQWPDSAVVERYGQMLLEADEQVEAGKYLFLSGVRKPEYTDAIALFLRRCGRGGTRTLTSKLPSTFRRLQINEMPEALQRELRDMGVQASAFGELYRKPWSRGPRDRFKDSVAIAAALFVLACFIVGTWLGFRAIVNWVLALFR